MYRYVPNTINFKEFTLKEIDYLIPFFGAFIDIAKAFDITYDPRLDDPQSFNATLSPRWQELTRLTEVEINRNLEDHRVALKPNSGFSTDGPVVYIYAEVHTLGNAEQDGEERPSIKKDTHRILTMTMSPVQTVSDDELHAHILGMLHLAPREEVFYGRVAEILTHGDFTFNHRVQALQRHLNDNVAFWNSQSFGAMVLRERFAVQPTIFLAENEVVAELRVYDRERLTKIYHSSRAFELHTPMEKL